ncbi:MAG: pilus assembly protein N-terminal domain-containing protein [Thiomicrorhabdus sp.]|nr:pilus assembly protein N-terminal domain-containing protein [Thiomicrorhabdus sp.]
MIKMGILTSERGSSNSKWYRTLTLPRVSCSGIAKMVLLFVMSAVWSAPALAKIKHMQMHVGSIKTLEVGSVIRVAIGNDKLLATSVMSNGNLLLVPKAPGETDLSIWTEGEKKRTFRIRILSNNMANRKAVINSLLQSYPDIKVRSVDDVIVVEGFVKPEEIESFTELLGGMTGVLSLVKSKKFVMEKMVKIKLRILEINKRFQKELGIKWGNVLDGPVVSMAGSLMQDRLYSSLTPDWNQALAGASLYEPYLYSYAGMAGTLASKIQLLEENGGGRTLAEPTLVSRAGHAARFHSGGEFPFVFISSNGEPRTAFKEYGIMVEMIALVDEHNNILLDIKAEVSSIDGSTIVNGVPGLLTRETNSTINVKPGETVAISGLLSINRNESLDKVPFFGDLPLIGGLFRSKLRVEGRTELIILATPELVETAEQRNPKNPLMDRVLKDLMDTKSGYLDEELLE